jgi:hypothetical protein
MEQYFKIVKGQTECRLRSVTAFVTTRRTVRVKVPTETSETAQDSPAVLLSKPAWVLAQPYPLHFM